ncbi:MAG: type II toxin-antitoxin system RelE/ParE family toxin [Patescibacteria group bacterium]|mgnify:CR=1 FL=1
MKIFQFQFSRKAEDEFATLAKPLRQRIFAKLCFFEKAKNPLSFAKKLTGREHQFRFRIGDYRIIVEPHAQKNGETVYVILVILKVGHRREVYE